MLTVTKGKTNSNILVVGNFNTSLTPTDIIQTQNEEEAWKGGGQDECYELQAKTMPKTAGSHQILGEKHGVDSPSKPPGGIKFADTFISGFWPSEL